MRIWRSFVLPVFFGGALLATLPVSAFTPMSLSPAVRAVPAKQAYTGKAAFATVISAVKPALVRIRVVSMTYHSGRESKYESFGSGVILSSDGYVVTNHHVAADSKYIICTMIDKEEIDAELIGTDALTDISVLKLKPTTPRTFPYARFGDSSAVQVGDEIFAMGSPLAFSQSVTMGVVSNTALVMPSESPGEQLLLDGEDVSSVVSWIAHDAAIFPGNSGGPLVTLDGEIVGINEISMGLSGAIPGNLVRDVVERIIADGKVTRSWVGISVQPLLKSHTERRGVLVTGAVTDSPAERAGVQRGDILLALGDRPVDVRFREELPRFNLQLMSMPIGEAIPLRVLRDGREITLTVTPEERQEAKGRTIESKPWGVCVSALTSFRAKELQRDSTAGILVESVRTGSPADTAKPGLCGGDILLSVAGTSITSPSQLCELTDTLIGDAETAVPVLVVFERDREQFLTVVKLSEAEKRDAGREIRKAWLPINIQVLTRELATALGLTGVSGMRVTQLFPHDALRDVDLRVGDIITAVDDVPIMVTHPEETEVLSTLIRQYRVGSTVEMAILREGAPRRVAITLPAAPNPVRELTRYRNDDYEFSARDIAFTDRVRMKLAGKDAGVVIESVSDGGWASLGQLSAGDLLVGVDGEAIDGLEALKTIMHRLANERPRTAIFQVRRGIRTFFLELEVSWPA